MGLLTSLNIGVSGLQAAGESMSVVGNNIANAQTAGFKKSRAEFQDMLSSSLKGIDGGDQIGTGTKLAHVHGMFTQGGIARTENITDVALNGHGFFAIEAAYGRGYTRDGQFQFSKEGLLMTGDGYNVLGFQADNEGKITNKVGAIKLGNTTIPASPTKDVSLNMNLDSRTKIVPFNKDNPDKANFYNNSVTVYDSQGNAHLVTLFFNRTGPNNWNYHAYVDGAEAAGGEPGKMVRMAGGTLRFNPKGQLEEEIQNESSFSFKGGAKANQKINFDFGKSIKEGGDGKDGSTHFGSDTSIARTNQDGYTAATLASMSFNDDGVLTAIYNNGVTKDLAQLAVAKFENNEGLYRMGKNLFKQTRKSGQGTLGKPGKDGRGEILSKSVELSNVDIAEEFVNLMNTQRNFQANTRTMSTSDKMLQEILNIKR